MIFVFFEILDSIICYTRRNWLETKSTCQNFDQNFTFDWDVDVCIGYIQFSLCFAHFLFLYRQNHPFGKKYVRFSIGTPNSNWNSKVWKNQIPTLVGVEVRVKIRDCNALWLKLELKFRVGNFWLHWSWSSGLPNCMCFSQMACVLTKWLEVYSHSDGRGWKIAL